MCNLLDIHLFLMNFRLTLHTVEDLQRELELKASMADKTARPNTPDWMSSIDPNAPLIYSPRVPPVTPPETPKTKVGSSFLKIKLNFLRELFLNIRPDVINLYKKYLCLGFVFNLE